jgi:hypothetical protein
MIELRKRVMEGKAAKLSEMPICFYRRKNATREITILVTNEDITQLFI